MWNQFKISSPENDFKPASFAFPAFAASVRNLFIAYWKRNRLFMWEKSFHFQNDLVMNLTLGISVFSRLCQHVSLAMTFGYLMFWICLKIILWHNFFYWRHNKCCFMKLDKKKTTLWYFPSFAPADFLRFLLRNHNRRVFRFRLVLAAFWYNKW